MMSNPPGCSSINGVTSNTSPRTAIQHDSSVVCLRISSSEMTRAASASPLDDAVAAAAAVAVSDAFFLRSRQWTTCSYASASTLREGSGEKNAGESKRQREIGSSCSSEEAKVFFFFFSTGRPALSLLFHSLSFPSSPSSPSSTGAIDQNDRDKKKTVYTQSFSLQKRM